MLSPLLQQHPIRQLDYKPHDEQGSPDSMVAARLLGMLDM